MWMSPTDGSLYVIISSHEGGTPARLQRSFDAGFTWDSVPWPHEPCWVHGLFVTSDGVLVALVGPNDLPMELWFSGDRGTSWGLLAVYSEPSPLLAQVRFIVGSALPSPVPIETMTFGQVKARFVQ